MIWKRWLKRTIVAVILVLALRTAWLVGEREWLRAQGEKGYAAAVAETDQTDPDWRWDALNAKRAKPPVGKNGAELIPRITELMPKDWGKELNDPEKAEQVANSPPNVRFPPELIALARRDLTTAKPAVDLARTFQDYPGGHREYVLARNPLDTLLPDVQNTRNATYLLRWDVVIAVEDGNAELAAWDLIAMLNVSRSLGDEPFLISQLVRIATRAIATRSLEWALAQTLQPDDRLAALSAAWAADADAPLLLYGLRGERAVSNVMTERLQEGRLTLRDVTGNGGTPSMLSFESLGWWIYKGRLPGDRAYMLRWFNLAIDAAKLPIHEQPAAVNALPIPPADDMNLILSRLFLPAANKVADASWRSTAEMRCTVVGIACERFRLKHGRWPKELAELSADLLPGGVPLDPFDGKPLRYRRLDDGVVIYSIGPDGADDEGTITRDKPNAPGTDIGFRLWDPEQRHKPAVQPGDGDAIPPPREVKP